MTHDEVKKSIIEWFCKNTIADKNIRTDENFFKLGFVDSLKFIELIVEFESLFNVKFSNDEFHNREFSTIDGLAKIICSKQ